MATLQITWPKHKYNSYHLHLYLNDEKLGRIKNGETIRFAVSPGEHKLSADLGPFYFSFEQTLHIKLEEGETRYLTLELSKEMKWIYSWYFLFLFSSSVILLFANNYTTPGSLLHCASEIYAGLLFLSIFVASFYAVVKYCKIVE